MIATIVISSIRTSKANNMPAIGALNTPAIAPADPQANNIIFICLSTLKRLPMFDAIALPVKTIGASNPTEPPKATVIDDVAIEDQQLCVFILPSFLDIAYITLLTP